MFKNRAIKKYFNNLYPYLKHRYGVSEYYSKGQVVNTVSECGFKQKYVIYALAIFLEKSDFELLSKEFADQDLQAIRKEVADKFFGGNIDYTYKHLAATQRRSNDHTVSDIHLGGGAD